jgi:LmbE family N-acetylglucosaminyl deacetylase
MGAVMSRAQLDADVEDRRIHGAGTPERAWHHWEGLEALEPMTLDKLAPRGARVVVVAPHPDDEVLGCGGALAMLARAGREIVVVGVTGGEASHAGSIAWTPTSLAAERHRERAAGLARLGLTAPVHALGLADGGVAQSEPVLQRRLLGLLHTGDVVFVPWRLDGHPDHEATGRAAVAAAAGRGCACWELPIWMWHWATPADVRVPWRRMRRLALDADARDRKAGAIAAHATQLTAIKAERRDAVLPDWALARLLRPFEVFIEPEASA